MLTRLLHSQWTATSLGAAAYLVTLVLFWPPPPPEARAETKSTRPPAGPSWEFRNPETDILILELSKEKEALALKEKDLKELAERLQNERAELYLLTQAVHQVQAEFDEHVTRVREEETANLKRLAKMYSTMSPEGAATVFKELDDGTVVKLMVFMKDADSAAVLESMARQGEAAARRVAALSERLRMALPEAKKNTESSS
jgi:flagellar motility protein MotE (MotC chaperone)